MNDFRNGQKDKGYNRNGKGQRPNGSRFSPGTVDVWAPFNFVPLSKHVWLPSWGSHVSHDLPFEDGYSGQIEIEVTALTNILVGGGKAERKPKGDMTSVEFFLDGDGNPAIPGSTIKGVIRHTTEIATFSRFKAVDDKTYAVRDLSEGGRFYKEKLTKAVKDRISGERTAEALSKAGFLFTQGGKWFVMPCSYGRIEHRLLENWQVFRTNRLHDKMSFGEKMGLFPKSFTKLWVDPSAPQAEVKSSKNDLKLKFVHFHSQNSRKHDDHRSGDEVRGLLVITGHVRNKHREFVFYNYDTSSSPIYEVSGNVIEAFLNQNSSDAESNDTPWGYWWSRLKKKRVGPQSSEKEDVPGIPIFYTGDNDVIEKLGLAQMFKMAYDYSTHNMIAHTANTHLSEDGYDAADLLFGTVKTDGTGSLKGRVSFGLFRATAATKSLPPVSVVLNSPKPSYYPFYVAQKPKQESPTGDIVGEYGTFMQPTADSRLPELRGWKRYLPRQRAVQDVHPNSTSGNLKTTDRVATELNALPAGTKFKGTIRFHNLRMAEVGALVAVIGTRFDKTASQTAIFGEHLVGMGKPYGYGRVSLQVIDAKLESNRLHENGPETLEGAAAVQKLTASIGNFISAIEQEVPAIGAWHSSDQVKALSQLSTVEGIGLLVAASRQPYMPLPQFQKTKGTKDSPQKRSLPRLPSIRQ